MRKIFLPLLLVALSPVAHSEGVQEVEIDAPLSGWHPAEGEDASFSQTINYPASSVNMADDQNISAQIRGKIKGMLRRVKFSRAGWWSTVPVCRRELNQMVLCTPLYFH